MLPRVTGARLEDLAVAGMEKERSRACFGSAKLDIQQTQLVRYPDSPCAPLAVLTKFAATDPFDSGIASPPPVSDHQTRGTASALSRCSQSTVAYVTPEQKQAAKNKGTRSKNNICQHRSAWRDGPKKDVACYVN